MQSDTNKAGNLPDLTGLPDYAVLRQVQDALWKIGEVHGAAVMIGAGFSRFAERNSATTPEPPLWNDFRDDMLRDLYPAGVPQDLQNPLVLAEEYRAALGEEALENLIRRRVRDDEWTPGALHRRLLQLPWADVLTTNWDTLLERSAAADPDTSYEVVRITQDIARARQPRIIKLHGTMPAHLPFIFSDEDFRTYPQRFAPFVNLAQEVLFENELCLLGFSGDDPNFLEWAGWVRDKLGNAARPIRLVGVLGLSPSRRRLLERRNITPIDLYPLVQDQLKEDRHKRAAEIFLEALWQARPKTRAEWVMTPEKEYGLANIQDTAEKLKRLVAIWAADRERHPGWLVTPYYGRHRARYNYSQEVVQLLAKGLDEVPAEVRLPVLFEAVWRWATIFWALPQFLEQEADRAAAADDDRVLTVERRVFLRVALVRAVRHRRDWAAFDERIARLEALPSADAAPEAAYERCLRARDEIDFRYIADHCSAVAGNDPVWTVRRASLQAELLDTHTAVRTVRDAYEEIRRRRSQDRQGLWLLSREAWASWLMQAVRFELRDGRQHIDRPDWPLAYKVAETDPWDELHAIDNSLNEAETDKHKEAVEREPLFDAGQYRLRSGGMRFVNSAQSNPFEQVTCLIELPLSLAHTDFMGQRFARSIEVSLAEDTSGAWASLRSIISCDRGLLDKRFSRVAVARLPLETVRQMALRLHEAIDFGRGKIATAGDYAPDWSSRLRTMTELLSRLCLRLDGDAALSAFRLGASLLSDRSLRHWWLLEGIGNLLRRSLQAVEPARRGEAALDVLCLPLPCERDFGDPERNFPDASELLEIEYWRARENSHSWNSRIAYLLHVAARNENAQSRQHAVFRLLKLFEADALTQVECAEFGGALWRHTGNDGFPVNTNLLPHVFLQLPSPNPELASRLFKEKVFDQLTAGKFPQDVVVSLLSASYTLQGKYRPYLLESDQALAIVGNLLKWKPLKPERQAPGLHRDFEDEHLADAIAGALASTLLPALAGSTIDSACSDAIFDRIADRTMPSLLMALPALARVDSSQAARACKAIRTGLLSQESRVVVPALTAIANFARYVRTGGSPVPGILVAETVSLCVMRREPALVSALRVVRLLLQSGAVTGEDRGRLIEALDLIRLETSYVNWRDDTRRSDIGLIRRAAVKIAVALQTDGQSEPVLVKWLACVHDDPMPEVRYALSDGMDE